MRCVRLTKVCAVCHCTRFTLRVVQMQMYIHHFYRYIDDDENNDTVQCACAHPMGLGIVCIVLSDFIIIVLRLILNLNVATREHNATTYLHNLFDVQSTQF